MSPLLWLVWAAAATVFVVLLVVRLRGHQGVVVRRTAEHVELWLRRGWRATLQGGHERADPLRSRLAYTDGFLLYPPPPAGRVLFIGCGAGIGPRQLAALQPGAEIRVVEISPAVAAAAEEHFGLRGPTVQIAEGRAFLAADAGGWDMIVLDAFGAGVYPARLATVEAFELMRDRLRDPGVLVVNLGGTLAGPLASVWAGLVAAFGAGQVRAHGVPGLEDRPFDATRRGNTLAYAFRGPVPAPTEARPEILPHLPAIARTPVTPPPAPPRRDAEVGDFVPMA